MLELNVTFAEFDNSLNFIFGMTSLPEDIDILNNPYIEYIGYELYQDNGIMLREKYEFYSCEEDHLNLFMKPHTWSWYNQPICFKDRESASIMNNWWADDYTFPVIGITYCMNTTANGNWCKS